ncbi:MAG: TetR/AcrR family transcriptional regulator [Deltaproteobacteria bacterium]|nr:TetR/AcrR family transcriptional regulator [Deltaproteobacteria bacterium]
MSVALDLPKRERNKQEKRARLLTAARGLFAKKGFAATTTAEVAARAGVGAGTLFLYFASKEDLLVDLFRAEMDRVIERAFATLPRRASLMTELLHVYGAMIEHHERDPELARAFVKEMLFVSAPDRAQVFDFIDGLGARVAERIALRQARGELDAGVSAQLVAENLFALFIARLQKWLGAEGGLEAASALARLSDAFAVQLRALEPRTPARKRRP